MTTSDILRKICVETNNDYRSGQRIKGEIVSEDVEEKDDCSLYFNCNVNSKTYKVYQLMDLTQYPNPSVKFLKEFNDVNQANIYSKQQFCHYTGTDPFIASDMTLGYKSTGNRPDVDLKDSTCDVDCTKEDSYIFIIRDDYFCGNALNPFIEWRFRTVCNEIYDPLAYYLPKI
jgi:hypothetical protein